MSSQFTYEMDILERHLDSFGHVNNATYLEIYEEARWDILEESGRGLEYIIQNKIGPVVLDINITYKKELRNREKIKVESNFEEMKNRLVMTFNQRILNEQKQIVSEIKLSIGVMDLSTRKLLNPSDEWVKAIGG